MPNGFTIPIPFFGPLTIHFYGVIIMLGALAAAWLASVEAKRRGQSPDLVWDSLFWVLLGGIIGARLWHVFTPPPSMIAMGITTQFYLTHPFDLIAVWNGGLGIPGAIIGGIFALFLYCRRRKLDFLMWADIAAPALALGQAIGRWGNFINQELYGRPTDLPWGITIQHETGYPAGTRFHPLFLYESIYNLLNMVFLLWIARRFDKRLYPGDVFLVYLITYPLGRFFLDFIRLDAALVGGLNINQTIMLVVALISATILVVRHNRKKTELQPADAGTLNEDEHA